MIGTHQIIDRKIFLYSSVSGVQSQASDDKDHNQPRYAKLIKLGCGWDQILWCAEEVGGRKTKKNIF